MTKAYIKLDPGLPDRKDYYPDGAFRALVTLFCAGAHQPKPGCFRSERIVKALLGRHARWLPYLVEEHDIESTSEGGYRIVGWELWQEGKYPSVEARMAAIESKRGPMTPAERAFLHRQRQRDASRDGQRDASQHGQRDASRDAPSDTSTSLNETSTATATAVTRRPEPTDQKINGTTRRSAGPVTDEELLALRLSEYRDPTTSTAKRESVRFWLQTMGVTDPDHVDQEEPTR